MNRNDSEWWNGLSDGSKAMYQWYFHCTPLQQLSMHYVLITQDATNALPDAVRLLTDMYRIRDLIDGNVDGPDV